MPEWTRSSKCGTDHVTEQCVEVLRLAEKVAVRDSKDPNGGVLVFSWTEWETFLAGVREGEFDRP